MITVLQDSFWISLYLTKGEFHRWVPKDTKFAVQKFPHQFVFIKHKLNVHKIHPKGAPGVLPIWSFHKMILGEVFRPYVSKGFLGWAYEWVEKSEILVCSYEVFVAMQCTALLHTNFHIGWSRLKIFVFVSVWYRKFSIRFSVPHFMIDMQVIGLAF